MSQTPSTYSCPPYIPASQITPDSVNEIPTQENTWLTQESRRTLFDQTNNSCKQSTTRNYYDQLFSSDSEDEENDDSSDMSISDTDCSRETATPHSCQGKSVFSFNNDVNSNYPNSDMSISDDDTAKSSSSDMSISSTDSNTIESYISESSLISDSGNQSSSSTIPDEDSLSLCSVEEWHDGNDTWGMAKLLDEKSINNLLGIEELPRPPPTKEVQQNNEIDKIGTFNIQNKYEHDIAAFLMIKENITFLSIQEPFPISNSTDTSWANYRKFELESARICCYETPYQIILFDSWKWGGKIISPFQSSHNGRVTGIAFGFDGDQKLGIISVYASTKECAISDKDYDSSKISTITLSVKKMKKELTHKFPGICIMIMGDLQETISTTDYDNIGLYRKDYNKNGILALLLESHTSIVRERNKSENYITRFGTKGGRGLDHIFFPNDCNNSIWISDAKIDKFKGSTYFPSDHSFIHCSLNRKGPNNNQDGQSKRKFDFRKVCNIRMKQTPCKDGSIELSLDKSQFKDCSAFREQERLYNSIQSKTCNSNKLTEYYLEDIEERTEFLYNELWKENTRQQNDGTKNELVEINEDHAIELSHILRKFHTGIKDVMTHLDCFQDIDSNQSAGTKRGRLRKEQGIGYTNSSPIQTKLRYLKIATKLDIHLLQQILLFAKDYRLRKRSMTEDFNFSNIEKSWSKVLHNQKIHRQSNICYQQILEELLEREKHIQAIEFETSKAKSTKKKKATNEDPHLPIGENLENMLPHTSDNMVKLINHWLHDSNCDQAFNKSNFNNQESHVFLSTESQNHLSPLRNLDIKKLVAGTAEDVRFFYQKTQEAIALLSRFTNKISRVQSWYKHSTLDYLLETNNIDKFTSKLMHKDRSAPETHTEIWDASLQSMRPCINEYEELIATSDHHNHWMANSKASEICAFAKIVSKGKLGYRGIKLSPNRKITIADVPKLIHNGDRLPPALKKAFVRAHGKHTASIFSPPEQDRPELFYPFFMLNREGDMNENENFQKMFYKAISGIPAKARYEGYHMAVVGRFGPRWQKALMNIAKLILIMRYVPSDLKRMARFPIPKPGRKNEYRPISLCHDLYCFISGICNKYSSAGIEKANFLQDSITAYRPGKGCGSLVTVEQCFREDCKEHDSPVVQIDEDEEKFFDRIPVEILLAAMRINGFPEQGYLEMKASAMSAKYVDIITKKGIAYAKFICGLEQGNPDSPTVANLVIKLKHDVWEYISDKASKIFKKNDNKIGGKYVFNSIDRIDGPVTLCKFGYCDDNSKYCFVKNENDLLFLTKYFLQLAGDLSMVTKIGRKGSKSEIQFFNVSAEFALKIKKHLSTAWSFVCDAPMEEEVPVKICLKEDELQKFMELSNYENMNQEDQESWDKIIFPKAHRHLGLTGTLSGITRETCKKTLRKMVDRIRKLKLHKMRHKTQKKAFNMLCGTIHSFAPVQVGYNMQELEEIDREFVKIIKKSRGLSSSDAKHRLFLPEHLGGMGFNSVQDTDIISTAREIEILSNSMTLESEAFRSRLAAIHTYAIEDIDEKLNHAHFALKKLAKLGIHFRDQTDNIINRIFSHLEKLPRYQALGSNRFRNGNGPHIGKGKEKNLEIMFGGSVHKILKMLESVNWNEKKFREIHKQKSPVAISKLIKMRKAACLQHFDELTASLSCWQWINTKQHTNIPMNHKEWSYIDIGAIIRKKFPTEFWKLTNHDVLEEAEKILQIPLLNADAANTSNLNGQYKEIWKRISNSTSPLFVATDGAHSADKGPSSDNKGSTSSSFVICIADLEKNNKIDDSEDNNDWTDLPSIPLLCRTAILPSAFGTHHTDIAHGELQAIAMQELAIPNNIPRILITDSEPIRNITLGLRAENIPTVNRKLIRTSMGGASKFWSSIIFDKINAAKTPLTNTGYEEVAKNLIQRNKEFLETAESWTASKPVDDEKESRYGRWSKEYLDSCEFRPILKVNSHQLNEQGNKIKISARYPKLIPNVSILSMNHHADKGAEAGMNSLKINNRVYELTNPPSKLRFQFTWEGAVVDRHVNHFIREKIYNERIIRLKTKDTQGLLWRFIGETTSTWSEITRHKGWLRALTGLSRSHTRSLYKSENYRTGCNNDRISLISVNQHEISEVKEETETIKAKEMIQKCKNCMWCPQYGKLNTSKGNRLHAMLHCSHPDLLSFRTRMSNTIEQQLKALFLQIQRYTSNHFIEVLLNNIEKECESLQKSNLGQKHNVSHNDLSYIPVNELIKKYGIANCTEGFHVQGKFCSEMLGIEQQHINTDRPDSKLGILDAYWLGMIPSRVDKVLKSSFSISRLSQFTPDNATCKVLKGDLDESWETIKELIMAKAIGLHRIIGEISKEKEKQYRKKYELSKGTFREIREEARKSRETINQQPQSSKQRVKCEECEPDGKENIQQVGTSINATKASFQQDKVACKGITCNRSNQKWSVGQNYVQQRISCKTKHCQRCSKFNTAMKQSAAILENIGLQPPSKKSKLLSKTISHAINNNMDYTLMTTMLEECQMPTDLPSAQAITIKKPNTKILDRHKLICRVITQAIKMTTFSEAQSQDSSTFTIAADKIRKGMDKGQVNLNSGKQHSQQKQKILPTNTNQEVITIDCSQDSNNQTNEAGNNVSLTRRKIFKEIEEDGRFISDDAVTMTVEVLRHTYQNHDIFIANGLANVTIENWNQTLGWERFGRIFGTRRATFTKPNGTYLIPIFSGGIDAGHWHLVVVHKTGRFHRGWIIDSLGKGKVDTTISPKIKSAFTTNRGRLEWTTPSSRRQVEYECGPRTLKGIIDICKGLAEEVSIETCIQRATLTESATAQSYNSGNIRREVLNLARSHNQNMRAERITFRQQGTRISAGRSRKRKRAPKRKIEKPAVAPEIIILSE